MYTYEDLVCTAMAHFERYLIQNMDNVTIRVNAHTEKIKPKHEKRNVGHNHDHGAEKSWKTYRAQQYR